ncbi:hypothetical protein AAFJ72_16400 [Brevibacillus gelatini]|uniref:hypothetical protein n=1 Tax=Brevibacillus gelatini TaxID=1655277 RepID=UPI003D813AD0
MIKKEFLFDVLNVCAIVVLVVCLFTKSPSQYSFAALGAIFFISGMEQIYKKHTVKMIINLLLAAITFYYSFTGWQ